MTDWYEDRVKLGLPKHFPGEDLGCGYCYHEARAIEIGKCERGESMGFSQCGQTERMLND
jgi:hypothetical protein